MSGKATMLLPEEFELMDIKMLNAKYPLKKHRPTKVYTDKEGTINIALNHTQNKAEAKDLQEVKKAMEDQFNQPTIELELQLKMRDFFYAASFLYPAAFLPFA